MTIVIEDLKGLTYEMELEIDGNSNENEVEYSFHGELENQNGDLLEFDVLQHRNHPFVDKDDITTNNIKTSVQNIAEQINEQLQKVQE